MEKLDPKQYEKRPVGDKLRQAWIEKNEGGIESMKPIEFLSPVQIQELQIQEAQSDKEQKTDPLSR